jgi:GNAT superfamily N-acetyltransferase
MNAQREKFRYEIVQGTQFSEFIPELAKLRMTVFREYPYLYDGTEDYEARYLGVYAKARTSLGVLVFCGDKMVGASTGVAMIEEGAEFVKPLRDHGIDPRDVFYLGESIVLKDFRGRGLGQKFFDFRESHARSLGRSITAFCAVERADDHPLRPQDYGPLDAFWKKQGYSRSEITTQLSWKEIGQENESPKTLRYWFKNQMSR